MRQPSDPFGDISIARPEPTSAPGPGPSPEAWRPRSRPPLISRKGLPPKLSLFQLLSRALILLLGGFILYLILGYFLVPYLIRTVVVPAVAKRLDRPLTVGQVDFDPLALRLFLGNGIVGPRLSDPSDKVDPIVSFAALTIDLELRSLPQRAVICREVTVRQPFVHLVHEREGRYNLTSLGGWGSQDPRWAAALRLLGLWAQRYSINNLSISRGEILYDDLAADKVHRVQELNLRLPVVANIAYQDGRLTPHASAVVNGTPIEMQGEARLVAGPRSARLSLKMSDLDLAAYTGYLPARFGIRSLGGQADLDLDLVYDAGQQTALRLSGALSLRAAELGGELGLVRLESGLVKGWWQPFSGDYHAEEVVLTGPFWQRRAEQALPWAGLSGLLLRPDPKQGLALTVDHLQISKGDIRLLAANPEQANDWQSIDVSLQSAGLTPGEATGRRQVFFSLDGHDAAGRSLSLQGNATTDPLSAKGLAVVNKIDVAALQALWQGIGPTLVSEHGGTPKGPLALLPVTAGTIEQAQAGFHLDVDAGHHLKLALEPLSIQARDLRLEQDGQVVEVPVWQSEQGAFSFTDRVLHLGKVRVQQAKLVCRRLSASGDWQTFLAPPAAEAGDDTRLRLDLSALDLANASLRLENQGPPDISLQLARLDLQVDRLDAQAPTPFTLAAMLDDKYPVQASGTFTLSPFDATLHLAASDLPLSDLAPVLARYFALPMSGSLAVDGSLRLPSLEYRGRWSMSDLAAPPLSCRRLSGEGTTLVLRPLSFALERLAVEGPALHLTAKPSGMPQFPTLMQPGWSPAGSPEAARVAIKRIDISDGNLVYDFPGPPGLALGIRKIAGSVSDCLVASGQGLPFTLSGMVEGKAAVEVSGTLSPFDAQPGLSLNTKLSGLPLVALAPILEPNWGFVVKAGSLDFEDQLSFEAEVIHDVGRLVLHDLTLGKPLATPAIKALGNTWQGLPLVQALMQDAAQGRIELAVPIDGRTDAGFTYLEGMRNYLNQLLLKAAVSPSGLLSGTEKGKGVPEAVDFALGSAQLTAAAEDDLRGLALLLKNRPLLALRLTGYADPAELGAGSAEAAPGEGEEQQASAEAGPRGLARRRGQVVQAFLQAQGLGAKRLRLAEPQAVGPGTAGRAGRRVGIELRPVD